MDDALVLYVCMHLRLISLVLILVVMDDALVLGNAIYNVSLRKS